MTLPPARSLEALLTNVGWVRSLARQLCADAHAAEDAAQATWVAAVQQPPREPGKGRSYLARLLRNVLHMHARGAGRRVRREREVVAGTAAAAPSAGELVERAELQQRVVAAVLALPAPQCEVVLRHYFEGEDVGAIAARSDRSPDAVRALLRRARERLRADLERSGVLRALVALPLPVAGEAALVGAVIAGGVVMQGKLALAGVAVVAAAGVLWLADAGGVRSGSQSSVAPAAPPAIVVAEAGDGAPGSSEPPAPAVASAPLVREAAKATSVQARLVGLHPRVTWRAPLAVHTTWHDGEREQSRDERASAGADGTFVVKLPPWSERCRDLRVQLRAEDELHAPLDWAQAIAIDAAELQVAVEPLPVLFGTVVDARGNAVADAAVLAFTVVDGVPKEGAVASERTAADGSFRLRVPAATPRFVAAVPPDARADFVAAGIGADASPVVELAPLVLPDAAAVTGSVRRADGSAVTSAEVEWLARPAVTLDAQSGLGWRVDGNVTRRIKAATDASGRFVLPALPGDKGRVLATRVDGCQLAEWTMVGAVAPQDVVLTVPGRAITVQVLADGAPAGIAGVEWRRKGVAGNHGTDDQGVLRQLVLDEALRMRAVSKDGARSSEWHEFPKGPPEHVVLELLPADGVPFAVAIDGVVLSQAHFTWRPIDGGAARSMRATAADGRFALRVPPGRYRVSLQAVAGTTSWYLLPAEHEITVPAGGGDARIVAVLGGRLRLGVTDAAGAFLHGHYRVLRDGAVLLPRPSSRSGATPSPDAGIPFHNSGPHSSDLLPPGACEVIIDLGARGEHRRAITLVAAETTEVFLRVP